MTENQLKIFLNAVKNNSSLAANLKGAGNVSAVVSVAQEAGFSLSADDLTLMLKEVSEKELESGIGNFLFVSCDLDSHFKYSCCAKSDPSSYRKG